MNHPLYEYSLCIALPLMLFFGIYFLLAPTPGKAIFSNYLRSRRIMGCALLLLAAVVVAYQTVGTLGEWALSGSFLTAVQDFRLGVPGMLLQVVGGWAFLRWILRR